MIIVTIDGMNWQTAKDIYKDTFPKQSMKKILCNVRGLTQPTKTNATPPGLTTLWSGVKSKNLHSNIFRKSFEDNSPIEFLDRKGNKLDLIWEHFDRCKLYEKVIGPNPYNDNKEYWVHYHNLKKLGVKFVPSEELCIFNETVKDDYDLFWIHTSIVKGAVFFPGPYEHGRIPSILQYDVIRKDKELKRAVYMMGIRRYKEVVKYLSEMRPDEIIVISSDHGTWTDMPYTHSQIDEIPLIVNRDVDLDDIKFQWDIKKLLLRLKNG